MYKLHTYCRACGYAKPGAPGIKSNSTEKLIEVIDLGIQPLANDFCKEGEARAGYAPLKVLFCPRCTLAQLSVVVDPNILYSHYNYVTSPSQMMRGHLKNLITDIAKETNAHRVLEIGSNDGRLLKMMQDGGNYDVTGVDPATNLAFIAESQGIHTHVGLFGEDMAMNIGQYDVIIARHVFCHVDNWRDFVCGLELVSHLDTLICIEVPYAGDTISNCEFDTIYHEHLSYLTLNAMKVLLDNTDLRLFKTIRYDIHGGAILLMLRHKDKCNIIVPTDHITVEDWRHFSNDAKDQIGKLRASVTTLRAQGKKVAALGASAKSTVWISACGFTRNEISFIADNTPQKQWTFSPGTDIPIVDEGAILRELPDYLVIFCWNYLSECLQKFSDARAAGVKFIVPVPVVKVV